MIILEVTHKKTNCLHNGSNLNLSSETLSSRQKLLHALSSTNDSVIILPALKILDMHTALICAVSSKGKLLELIKNGTKLIAIPDEFVKDAIDESEINKALRVVFRLKPNPVYISLPNPHARSNAEKNLHHVLKGAGYTSITSSSLLSPVP